MIRNPRTTCTFFLLGLLAVFTGCEQSQSKLASASPTPTATPAATPTAAASPEAASNELKTARSGLQYQDLEIGVGQKPLFMQEVRVAYVGKFQDGHVFDKGLTDFRGGKGEMLKGFEQGIFGGSGIEPMRVGGKRKLIIPPQLGYGDKPYGTIPANSTLTFEVELLRVNSKVF
ncbi:MAG: FKBP-type peptidyl-prolyl cis-trans isomerase [Acidobacteria bacterium]|nr:FKBP-type peptidyl-prolyl cis-trans isomerase [Acidobacteriota bacterium]